MRIPPGINQKVIEDWLNGFSRDEIAQRNDLSAGTVSNIIKQTSKELEELDFEFLRQISKTLKKDGIKFNEFIDSVRIRNRIQDMGLNIEKAERYIELMDEHCFRKQIEPEKFIEGVDFLLNLPNEERNVEIHVQKIKALTQETKLKNEKLNDMNNRMEENSKSIMKMKREEKILLMDLNQYKEIKDAIDFAKTAGIHIDLALWLMIKEHDRELFGSKK